jgi:hypothetical protein
LRAEDDEDEAPPAREVEGGGMTAVIGLCALFVSSVGGVVRGDVLIRRRKRKARTKLSGVFGGGEEGWFSVVFLISLRKGKKGEEKMGSVSDGGRRPFKCFLYLVLGEGVAIDGRPSLPAVSRPKGGY